MSVITDLLHWNVLIPWMLGMMFGVFVGATPGLTATMAVALLVPASYYLPPDAGLAMVLGVSFTAIFAGDIPATYLRIPGTPSSAVATLDSYELAQKGHPSLALSLNLSCSFIGGLIGVLLLMLVAPQLAKFALRFSNVEYFWLALLGLSMSAVVSVGSSFRGMLSAALGVLLSTVGLDVVTAAPRFGTSSIEFIPAMIGLYGLSEVIRSIRAPGSMSAPAITHRDRVSFGMLMKAIWRNRFTVAGSSLLGTLVGALPGAGADIAAWCAYGVTQRLSREGHKFGSGCEAGVIAPTSANNAAIAGAWIPALVLGIPGDSITAIVLGAMLTYNIKPGPRIFIDQPQQMHALFMIALMTQVLLLPCGWLGIRLFGWILRLPRAAIMSGVVVFSVLGAFAIRNTLNDVWLMCAFGVLGFLLDAWRVPLAPLILGLILGEMIERNLRVGLIKTGGDFGPFFSSGISQALVGILLAVLFLPAFIRLFRRTSLASLTANPSSEERSEES